MKLNRGYLQTLLRLNETPQEVLKDTPQEVLEDTPETERYSIGST